MQSRAKRERRGRSRERERESSSVGEGREGERAVVSVTGEREIGARSGERGRVE